MTAIAPNQRPLSVSALTPALLMEQQQPTQPFSPYGNRTSTVTICVTASCRASLSVSAGHGADATAPGGVSPKRFGTPPFGSLSERSGWGQNFFKKNALVVQVDPGGAGSARYL